MEGDFFERRRGTRSDGENFENLFIAVMILELIRDDGVINFKLSASDDKIQKFDDVVLEVVRGSGVTENYCIQLKYNSNRQHLTVGNLTAPKGDFSLDKYMSSVETTVGNYKYILFTSKTFNIQGKFKIEHLNCTLRIKECDLDELLKKCGGKKCIRFDPDDEGKNFFFKHFFLYANGPKVEHLRQQGSNVLQQMFSCDRTIFESYVKFIDTWSNKKGRVEGLNKIMMKQVIAIHLLSPFIRPISFNSGREQTKKVDIFRRAVMSFDITFVEENCEQITQIWSDNIQSDDPTMLSEIMNKIGRRYQLNEEFTKMWLINKCPLIVSEHVSVYKAIELCDEKNFIILFKQTSDLQNDLGFRNLTDLEPFRDIYLEVLQTFTCSLQGKEEITLEELIHSDSEIQNLITPKELFQMLDNPLYIGECNETVPRPYISRSLTCPFIDYRILEKIDSNTLIILGGLKNLHKLKSLYRNISITVLKANNDRAGSQTLFLLEEPSETSFCNIYVTKTECDQTTFTDICTRSPQYSTYHQFRFIKDSVLEWVRSAGGVDYLEEFQIQTYSIKESLLPTCDSSIYLVCGQPGIGKTILCKSIKNNFYPKLWTLLIYPNQFTKFLRENGRNEIEFLQHILNEISKKYTSLDFQLFEIFKKQNRLCFIWDGVDEVSGGNLETIYNVIESLSKKGVTQWITCRSNLKSKLENRFSIMSRTIIPLNDEQQREYIQERLHFSVHSVEDFLKQIDTSVPMFRYREIFGIPLQIYLFTDLLCENLRKYHSLLGNILSVVTLYQYFIDKKFDVFFETKKNCKNSNDLVYECNQLSKNDTIEKYQRAAIKVHLPEEILQNLQNTNCEDFLNSIRNTKDPVGIITNVSEDNVPIFLHNSYGEYFTALYLSKHYKNIPQLSDFIFTKRYKNIRFIFDLLLADKQLAHIAVINKDLELLKKINREQLMIKDIGGRNPLHLACSWGESYPTLYTRKVQTVFHKKYVVDDRKTLSVRKEDSKYGEILEYLSEHCEANDKDDIFNFDVFSYADVSRCILPLVILSSRHKINFKNLNKFKDIMTVLYFSLMLNSTNILNIFKEVPIVESLSYKSILLLVVEYNSVKCLTKMVTKKIYMKHLKKYNILHHLVTIACEKGYLEIVQFLLNYNERAISILHEATILHTACDRGHYDIVQLLIDHNVDTNTPLNDLLPIHRSLINKYYNIAKLLVKNDANVSAPFNYKQRVWVPLHFACSVGNFELVRLLLDHFVEVNTINVSNGMLPIHYACEQGDLQIVTFLCDRGADINALDKAEKAPIIHAYKNGHYKTVETLIIKGARVNTVFLNFNKTKLIHRAAMDNHFEIMKLLINEGANVDDVDLDGEVPLHVASKNGHLDIVELLIVNGAKINVTSKSDLMMPLHYACVYGHFAVVKFLVKNGAEVNAEDAGGMTAIHWASGKRHYDIVQLLIDYGANVNDVIRRYL